MNRNFFYRAAFKLKVSNRRIFRKTGENEAKRNGHLIRDKNSCFLCCKAIGKNSPFCSDVFYLILSNLFNVNYLY